MAKQSKKKPGASKKAQYTSYKAQDKYTKNRAAKLERHLKKFPADETAKKALKNIKYRRQKPKSSIYPQVEVRDPSNGKNPEAIMTVRKSRDYMQMVRVSNGVQNAAQFKENKEKAAARKRRAKALAEKGNTNTQAA